MKMQRKNLRKEPLLATRDTSKEPMLREKIESGSSFVTGWVKGSFTTAVFALLGFTIVIDGNKIVDVETYNKLVRHAHYAITQPTTIKREYRFVVHRDDKGNMPVIAPAKLQELARLYNHVPQDIPTDLPARGE